MNISCFGLGGQPSAKATFGIAKAAAVAASTSRLVLMTRSAKNCGTNLKFDADPLAMQRIWRERLAGRAPCRRRSKAGKDVQSPDVSRAFSLRNHRGTPKPGELDPLTGVVLRNGLPIHRSQPTFATKTVISGHQRPFRARTSMRQHRLHSNTSTLCRVEIAATKFGLFCWF